MWLDGYRASSAERMTEPQQQTSVREHWYYVESDTHVGPVTKEFLESSIVNGSLSENTLVWREGLSTWIKAGACPFLQLTSKQPPSGSPPAFPQHGERNSATPSPPATDTNVKYAGLHWRLLAGIIDTVVMFLPAFLSASIAEAIFGPSEAMGWIFVILVWWIYYAVLHASRWQASLGMKLLRMKITGRTGERIDFGRATGRYFASLISSVFCYAGYLIIPFTPKRQGLHDLVASTFVIKES
jgi:uncharacterized RDD family membrane protein YckC